MGFVQGRQGKGVSAVEVRKCRGTLPVREECWSRGLADAGRGLCAVSPSGAAGSGALLWSVAKWPRGRGRGGSEARGEAGVWTRRLRPHRVVGWGTHSSWEV